LSDVFAIQQDLAARCSIRRLTIFRVVVLPQPLGPTSTQISPGRTLNERSSTAAPPSWAEKRFVTCRSSTAAPGPVWALPGVAISTPASSDPAFFDCTLHLRNRR